MITGILDGIWIGHTSLEAKRIEEAALQGVNQYNSILGQMLQIANVDAILKLVQRQLSAASTFQGLLSMPPVVYLTPIIISALCTKVDAENYPRLKRTLNLINTHVGTVCHVAIAVSALWLIFCGQVVGYVSLAFMILGVAQRRFLLPLPVSFAVDRIGFVGTNVSRILTGDPFYIVIGTIDISNFVSQFLKKQQHAFKAQKASYDILNLPSFYQMQLRLNPQHLGFRPVPPPPSTTNIDTLQNQYDAIPLNDELEELLLDKVTRDQHWKMYHSHENTAQQKIAYVREGLKQFIQRTGHRKIHLSTREKYEELENRVKSITHTMSQRENNENKFEKLVELAISGHYCPSNLLEETDNLYRMICQTHEKDSVEYRFNDAMSVQRGVLVDSVLSKEVVMIRQKLGPAHWFMRLVMFLTDPQDRHNRNFMLNLLGDDFGVSNADALQDESSYVDFISKKLLRRFFQKFINDFKGRYTVDYVLDTLKELPAQQEHYNIVRRWLIEEFKTALEKTTNHRLQETDVEYQVRLRELAQQHVDRVDARYRGIVFDEETGRLREEYLAYVLVQAGILERIS